MRKNSNIKFSRVWAMPSAWTFRIKPIRDLVLSHVGNGAGWIDPFAGNNSPAEYTNDLNPERPTKYHMDALQFLIQMQGQKFNGVLYDPPYSLTQAKECYASFGAEIFKEHDKKVTMMDYWSECKSAASNLVCEGGIVICCGWNSNGFGIGNGFELLEVMNVAHGGSKNDTIVTVERKIKRPCADELFD